MSYWIGLVLREARVKAELTERDISTALKVTPRTIERFEKGVTMVRVDEMVATYAFMLGYDDGRGLWERALRRWQREGAPPGFIVTDDAASAFAQAIRLESLRRRRGAAEKSGRRRANP